MKVFGALLAVCFLVVIALLGVKVGLAGFFGVAVPYAAFALFLFGFLRRVVKWARSAVPFNIPTTCGQQKALDWIPCNTLEAPPDTFSVVKRMFLEVVLFRSLFRNTRTELREGPMLAYASSKWLWMAGLAFHAAFFTILLRHLRLFTGHVPLPVTLVERVDGFFQITLPALYLTDLVLMAALGFLLLRRLLIPQMRYLSLANDYFPLFLLLGIGTSGMLMRHVTRVDVAGIKELAVGLATLSPSVPEGLGATFFVHLFLVSTLMAYFPFSKLMHAAGVFLSPTRNLANNSREKRHVNPWNPEVKLRKYAEYEDEFRDVMKAAGIPVERE